MTAERESKSHLCHFDERNPCGNLKGYEDLVEMETCDHVRKALPKATDYELYIVMDSNCHQQPPASNPCNKVESSDFRLILKWTKGRNNKPRSVSCFLTSYRPDLLRFPDGVRDDAGFSTLDLKKKHFVLTPVYKKKVNCRSQTIRVEKTHGFESDRAPVKVEAFLWKDYPNNSSSPQNAFLEIAIPPSEAEEGGQLVLTQASYEQTPNAPLELSNAGITDALANLLPTAFDDLLQRLSIPYGLIPPDTSPLRTRAIQVVQWVESQEDAVRQRLLEELKRVAPRRFGI